MKLFERVAMFVEETTYLLQRLQRGLHDPQAFAKPEAVHSLFRAAHTIRGNAALIGATEYARLTRVIERVLEGVRDKAIAPDADVVDSLVQSVDVLRQMTHAIASGEPNPGPGERADVFVALEEFTGRAGGVKHDGGSGRREGAGR